MNFDLNDNQISIRNMVREFAEGEIAPRAYELDAKSEFPVDLVRKMGELGLMGLPFPEEWGGLGADTLTYAIAVEELARVDSSMAITVAANVSLGGMPIAMFGNRQQKEKYLVPLAQGEALGAFGLTEPGAGSDAGNSQTTAVEDGNEWVINGTKSYITNAGTPLSRFVTIAVATGNLDGGGRREISNIVVENGTPGYTQSKPYKKMGWHASDTRQLYFENCRVPRENLVGERGRGFRQFLQVLDGGRISVAAIGVGLAQGALEMSLKYARERTQFGQPISKFQSIQNKLADMAVNVELARLATYRAAWLKDQGRPFAFEAGIAKLFSSEIAMRAADEGVQIHGGLGYMDEAPISRFFRDAKILAIGEGTSEVQRLVIARHLGC